MTDQLPAESSSETDLQLLSKALPASRNPARVYVASLGSPESKRNAISALLGIAEILVGRSDPKMLDKLPWHQLRYQHVAAIRSRLQDQHKPSTVNARLSVLRGVLREAYNLELLDADGLQRILTVQNVKGTSLPPGRVPTMRELQVVFDVCKADESPAGHRDAALIAVMVGGGLRRSEACALRREDYNAEQKVLRVQGKGRNERLAPINGGTAHALRDWLAIRGDTKGPLFWRVNKGGVIEKKGISQQVAFNVLAKRVKQAGLKDKLTPHDLRRSFATYLLDAGADVFSVQRLMGHAQPQTTMRYDRRDEDAKREAVKLLTIPY